MIPGGVLSWIRAVTIHSNFFCIRGFSFFDKNGALLCQIGYTAGPGLKEETVEIFENEVIVGVDAKRGDEDSGFTDF